METTLRKKWMILTALIVILLAIIIGFISYKQEGKIDYKQISALIGSSVALFAIFINFIFSKDSNKGVTELKDEFEKTNQRISDISKALDTEKQIVSLGRNIENFVENKLNDKMDTIFRSFINDFTTEVSRTSQYRYSYGFEGFDTENYMLKLKNILKKSQKSIDFNDIQIINDIESNIAKYIYEIDLIKNLENGVRRKNFERKTMSFIKNMLQDVIYTYENIISK